MEILSINFMVLPLRAKVVLFVLFLNIVLSIIFKKDSYVYLINTLFSRIVMYLYFFNVLLFRDHSGVGQILAGNIIALVIISFFVIRKDVIKIKEFHMKNKA
ncbi:hypothetical protein HYG86_13175 [Alkalicella caledoniensis]|uniref:Uncharacterized protein n=1 Tax=Alkalicella caledoniensis TaxID=2731377 RepID=A0A7G9WAE7_ALKCA|nr:hypothetical protein [Alkalicella caledoniensis]QNO15659.1 hypothetical protein HYG86_13175 [Alkalicella caledoniensis]